MALFERGDVGEALVDLFQRERDAILTGRFDVLQRLAHEKERLFSALARRPADADALHRLHSMAGRNGKLLSAMERGVRAAGQRLKKLSGQSETLRTYDANGARQDLAEPRHALQRRA